MKNTTGDQICFLMLGTTYDVTVFGTYLGSGNIIFLLALAAGVDLLFSIAMR